MFKVIYVLAALTASSEALAKVGADFQDIRCSGWTPNHDWIELRIKPRTVSPSKFMRADVEYARHPNGTRMYRPYQMLPGCADALFAGVTSEGLLNLDYSGDLYLECDGDGDAGNIHFRPSGGQGDHDYSAELHSAEGMKALGLGNDLDVALNCWQGD